VGRMERDKPGGREPLIPKHGGYRNLKSFQLAQLVYDLTVRFCDRYINKRSRTHDQMVQAARSGERHVEEDRTQTDRYCPGEPGGTPPRL